MLQQLNNWFTNVKQYFFTYEKGFFFLSYLSNNPLLIIESSKKLPFMKFDEENQILFSDNNPFTKTSVHYMELEKGLWVINSKVYYKNNVSFKPIYDTTIPADYYSLAINIVENNVNTEFYEFNNFKIENKSISFVKPKKDFINCHFKGTFENLYVVYFNKEWAESNLLSIPNLAISIKNLFLNDDIGFVNYKLNNKIFEDCIDNFHQIFAALKKPNLLALKKNTYHFFDLFISSINELQVLNSNNLNLSDRQKLQKIEIFLINNLHIKFPGIEFISCKHKISSTKLKKDFKSLYGMSLYQYFQSKQMELALELIIQNEVLIKDLAKTFQFENGSKFSKAFQKYHGFFPSKANFK